MLVTAGRQNHYVAAPTAEGPQSLLAEPSWAENTFGQARHPTLHIRKLTTPRHRRAPLTRIAIARVTLRAQIDLH